MGKRKAMYKDKITGGVTKNMNYDILMLKKQTGKTKSALTREAFTLLIKKYKEAGYL